MLHTEVLHSAESPLGDLLAEELENADQFLAASAFLNSGGLAVIRDRMENILRNEGRVSIIHGADFRVTDPMAVRTLVDMSMRYGNMSYAVHSDWNLTAHHRFHPKLYIATSDYKRYCVVVGSSNLTLGGLRYNSEVNTVIRGDVSDTPIGQCLRIYESIFNNTAIAEPDLRFAENYAALHGHAAKLPPADEPPVELEHLYGQLIELQRKSVRADSWTPSNQMEFVIKAMQTLLPEEKYEGLLRDAEVEYLPLESIYNEAEKLARNAGMGYKWSTWHNSIRGRINDNVTGVDGGGGYFIRRRVPRGWYTLSERGRRYKGKN